MFTRRLLQFINALIGLALLAAGGAAYWFGWRPLPLASGTAAAPVSKPARVERDAQGLPHIQAETLEDLFFTQGFVTAQDRFWQMETFRRLAAGELAEIVGPPAIESDREFRRLRLSRLAERRAATVAGEDKVVMAAYARGVNHYLETHHDKLPLEFALLGVKPRPWRIEDSVLIGLMMAQRLSNTYKHDLAREAMYEKGDPEKIQRIWPVRTGADEQPGSNAWAIAGSRTRSGKAALANDMHLDWSMPGIWYMMHLKGAGIHAAGVTVPGSPAIVVGRNDNIAWGITNLGFDVQDLYYVDAARDRQATVERERIPIRGAGSEPFQQFVFSSGPALPGPGGKVVALRWNAAEDRPFHLALVDLNRARNWAEFREALRDFPSAASNVTYADAQGNIGLQVNGLLPIRKDCDGQRVNAPGTCQWEGFIPYEELPTFYNPPSGRVVTANQNPFPKDYKYTVGGNFAPQFRFQQIVKRLDERKDWTPGDLVKLQADVYSPFSHWFARELVVAFDRKKATNPELKTAVDQLREWDGQMRASQPAPLLVTYATSHLRRSVAGKASKSPNIEWEPYIYFAVLESLVRERPAGWFADWDHELLRCLQEGIDEGSRRQGRDTRKWTWGEYQKLTLANPVTARIPWIGGYFQLKPQPMDGSSTTIRQTTLRLGPSMRIVVDFGDPAGGRLVLPTGQSGHMLSSHARDQWDTYLNGGSYPIHFHGGWEAKAVLTLTPE
ncbi:MAG: penicillin acylase family protein [Acidobacteria bacterium]|nr:penicillin acylase family protein [Acidobacteriota bacterium]